MRKEYAFFQPPKRLLMGPGPSHVDPRIYQAMGAPTIGHSDPAFFGVVDDISELLRYLYGTTNDFTIAVSGTGTAAMEASVLNFIEAGTKVAIFANGYFSERLTEMCRRREADIVRLEKPWGEVFSDEEVAEFIASERPQIVGFIHAETSTGALQPAKAICDAAHEIGALVIGDCVTSLGGMPVEVDANGIDIAYAATQKCIGAPPGLSTLTLSPAALERLHARRTPSASFYLDLKLIAKYWGESRLYHHTTPINMYYALREALRIAYDEGLEVRFARHQLNHQAFVAGVEALGLEMHVAQEHRIWTLNTPAIPDGVDADAVRRMLLDDFGIEVLGGFGPLAGRVLRVGLMGASSARNNVLLLLEALESCLRVQGFAVAGSGARAAEGVYSSS